MNINEYGNYFSKMSINEYSNYFIYRESMELQETNERFSWIEDLEEENE